MASLRQNYIWQKRAAPRWLRENQAALEHVTRGALAIIERPGRSLVTLEYFCPDHASERRLRAAFGGAVKRLPRDWQRRILHPQKQRPIRIGKRLVVANAGRATARCLLIPAAAAFGTGEHATTSMCLRILERTSRSLGSGWRLLDLGTGSGILALAARRFGSARTDALDIDPVAIATARANARLNSIHGVRFRVADAEIASPEKYDVIIANLYGEVVVRLAPRLRRNLRAAGHLIVSGLLREEQRGVLRALRNAGLEMVEVRRRGKWVALRAVARSGAARASESAKHLPLRRMQSR